MDDVLCPNRAELMRIRQSLLVVVSPCTAVTYGPVLFLDLLEKALPLGRARSWLSRTQPVCIAAGPDPTAAPASFRPSNAGVLVKPPSELKLLVLTVRPVESITPEPVSTTSGPTC